MIAAIGQRLAGIFDAFLGEDSDRDALSRDGVIVIGRKAAVLGEHVDRDLADQVLILASSVATHFKV